MYKAEGWTKMALDFLCKAGFSSSRKPGLVRGRSVNLISNILSDCPSQSCSSSLKFSYRAEDSERGSLMLADTGVKREGKDSCLVPKLFQVVDDKHVRR